MLLEIHNIRGNLLTSPSQFHNFHQAVIMVVIPDIFESFMSRDPERNIHYNEIGEESLQWTIK